MTSRSPVSPRLTHSQSLTVTSWVPHTAARIWSFLYLTLNARTVLVIWLMRLVVGSFFTGSKSVQTSGGTSACIVRSVEVLTFSRNTRDLPLRLAESRSEVQGL